MLTDPGAITERLHRADRTCQRERGGSFFFRSIKYFLGLVLVCFLVDVFLHLNASQRLALLGLWGAVVLVVLGRFAYLTWVRRNQLERIARVLESRDPALGSKLINLLQLHSQTTDASLAPLTRQLAEQAVAGYADDLAGVDLQRLAKTQQLKTELKRAVWAGLAFMAVLGAFYRIAAIEVARFTDPCGDHPPYSVTRLEIVDPGPAGAQVVYGQSHLVKVSYAGHRPGELYLTCFAPDRPDKPVTVPMFGTGDRNFEQQIERIQSDLVLIAHTKGHGSYSPKRQLSVILTPKLDKAFVQIIPPAYTGLKAEEQPYQFKNLRALLGSRLLFRLQSNRPLREGVIEVVKSESDRQRVLMTNSGPQEVTGIVEARDSARLRFSVVDTQGLPSQDTWEGSLTLTYDLPPEIQIAHPAKDSFVAIDFQIAAQIEATDDYGLKQMRIHLATNQVFFPPNLIAYTGAVRGARETVPLDFRQMGVRPGDVVSLFAEAIDTAPEPNLTRSQTVNLTLISVEDYNAFLRENSDVSDIQAKYDELLGQLQDLVADQKKLGEEIDSLRGELAKSKLKPEAEAAPELDRLLARQNELNRKLDKLAGHFDQFVRKEPVYDIEKELQKILSQKANVIRSSTATNQADTAAIAARSAPASGSRQVTPQLASDFKQASDNQLGRLGGAQEQAQQQVIQPLQDMSAMHELMKDFNEFQALYQAQKTIAGQTRAYARPGQLGREEQLALKNLAGAERDVKELLDQLTTKLRDDAKAAEKLFPKASQSGKDLAKQMEAARLSPLAEQTTDTMLAGNGENSFQLSDRLRSEMEKLFSECKSQGGQMGNEMDTYLKLQRGLNPGNSAQQMQQSRKFGNGQSTGMAMGTQTGQAGNSGTAASTEPTRDVLGNEALVEHARVAKTVPAGLGPGKPETGAAQVAAKTDIRKGLKPINRQSEAVASEAILEEYRSIVDNYFRTITK